jgi:hypothetical protein
MPSKTVGEESTVDCDFETLNAKTPSMNKHRRPTNVTVDISSFLLPHNNTSIVFSGILA